MGRKGGAGSFHLRIKSRPCKSYTFISFRCFAIDIALYICFIKGSWRRKEAFLPVAAHSGGCSAHLTYVPCAVHGCFATLAASSEVNQATRPP